MRGKLRSFNVAGFLLLLQNDVDLGRYINRFIETIAIASNLRIDFFLFYCPNSDRPFKDKNSMAKVSLEKTSNFIYREHFGNGA